MSTKYSIIEHIPGLADIECEFKPLEFQVIGEMEDEPCADDEFNSGEFFSRLLESCILDLLFDAPASTIIRGNS